MIRLKPNRTAFPSERPYPRGTASLGSCPRTGGFSFLELILVMLIMALILALAAPRFRGFAASREVHDTAASLVALIKWARMKSIDEGRPYRLYLDINRNYDYMEYWLAAQEGANFVRLGVSMGQRFFIPLGITAEWFESQQAELNGYIEFDPSGRAEVATIRLIGKLGTVLDVTCRAPGEPYRVERRPDEEIRYG